MTEEEIVYDIMMKAEGYNLSDDSRYDEYDYVAYLMRNKRAKVIRDQFRRNKSIDAAVIQNSQKYDVTKVDGADDPLLGTDLELGKITIPELVSFHDDSPECHRAIIRLSTESVRERFYETSENKFHLIQDLEGERKDLWSYFFIRNNELFIYPFREKVNVSLVLENPLDGFVMDTEYKTTLVVGTSYTVAEGSVTENSVVYQKGDVWSAATTSFTGSGKVVLTTQKRAMVKTDKYPMPASMEDYIIRDFIQKEFRLGSTQQSDARNDSADIEINRVQE